MNQTTIPHWENIPNTTDISKTAGEKTKLSCENKGTLTEESVECLGPVTE